MPFCYKSLSKAELKCIPLLIYTKNGNLLKSYGLEKKHICSTIYHVLVKRTNHCYVFKPLFPVEYCGQYFLKKMNTTTFLDQNCMLGMNRIGHMKIVNEIILRHTFSDCIKGEFQISQGFEQATIWQSNIHNYTGEAEVHYSHGKDSFLLIHVKYKNGSVGTYTLFKNNSMTIYLANVKSVMVVKQNIESVATGSYSINVYGEVVNHIRL